MDIRDGRIYSAAIVAAMALNDQAYMKEMAYDPTPRQRKRGKVGRNDPCPCGSGRKFKKCCVWRSEIDKSSPIPVEVHAE